MLTSPATTSSLPQFLVSVKETIRNKINNIYSISRLHYITLHYITLHYIAQRITNMPSTVSTVYCPKKQKW